MNFDIVFWKRLRVSALWQEVSCLYMTDFETFVIVTVYRIFVNITRACHSISCDTSFMSRNSCWSRGGVGDHSPPNPPPPTHRNNLVFFVYLYKVSPHWVTPLPHQNPETSTVKGSLWSWLFPLFWSFLMYVSFTELTTFQSFLWV